jgi:sarcosine oxidase subunit beta
MPEHHRVILIGGGVAGASCLYHLADSGLTDCLLLEQGGLANGSSGRSAAFIETQYLDEDRIRLCTWSLDVYERFARDHGLRYVRTGKLLLGSTDEDLQAFDRSISLQRAIGSFEPRILDPAEVGALAPALRLDGLLKALWGPRDGYTDAGQLCQIYTRLAEERGSKTLVSTRVEAIRVEESGKFVLDTDRGQFTCDIVINSSGAWASQLAALVGVHVPVAGYRRQVGVYEIVPLSGDLPIVVTSLGDDGSPTLYFRPDGEGRILAGLHSEVAGDAPADDPETYRRQADSSFTEELARLLRAKLDVRYELRTVGGWGGLYPLTPDGEFILGEAPGVPHFYNAVGLGGNGIQLSAAIGRITSELIVDGQSTLAPSLDRYLLERFDRPAGDTGVDARSGSLNAQTS